MHELKASEERSKKAMMDAARLADELRQEQEHAQHVERARKGLEQQIKVPPFSNLFFSCLTSVGSRKSKSGWMRQKLLP